MKARKIGKNVTNADVYEQMHREAIEANDAIELGPTNRDQQILFEKIRTNLSHGHVLKDTFDEAVKKRCKVDYGDSYFNRNMNILNISNPETFDLDVIKIRSMTRQEILSFDREVCHARMEIRSDDTGGVYIYPDRASGFGSSVFGFAYDLCSGRWCSTNEIGLHASCGSILHMNLSEEDGDVEIEIVSGFIFQLNFIKTPVMTPFGYIGNSPKLMRKGFEDMWSWKRFIPIHEAEIEPRKYRWKELFTPEFAEKESSRSY